jgi:putative Holliday junction resolvase
MRIIGIDYGDSRIGLAVSDPLGWTAGGLDTIANNGDIDAVLTVIKDICESYDAGEIVVGFPRNMNGTVGPRAEKTETFIKRLEENTGLNVVRWDERLTTVAAQKAMLDMGLSPSRKKGMVDRIAAIYILQSYLDSRRNNDGRRT